MCYASCISVYLINVCAHTCTFLGKTIDNNCVTCYYMISAYYHLCYLCTTLLHIILFHKPRTHAASSFLGERGPEHWPAHSCPRPHHQPLAEPGPSNICWTHTQNPGVQGFGFSRLLPRFHNLPNWINTATLHTQMSARAVGRAPVRRRKRNTVCPTSRSTVTTTVKLGTLTREQDKDAAVPGCLHPGTVTTGERVTPTDLSLTHA